MERLEQRLGYAFRDRSLLERALTHSSYANENRGARLRSNERLEFLGDSVLGMVVAEHLFAADMDMPEGELTRLRAALVCEQSLAAAARDLQLGEYLRLGRGEAAGGGRTRPSILADAMEAVLAAVYLDGGLESAREVVRRMVLSRADPMSMRDCKTMLQELVQRTGGQQLTYRVLDAAGPDHDKTFTVEVCVNGAPAGRGTGHSKKEAEQQAACEALRRLEG